MKIKQFFFIAFLLCLPFQFLIGQSIIYVKQNAVGGGNGQSWATAYNDLQTALTTASFNNHIYIAAGEYKPTPTSDRGVSFVIPQGIKIFGGFPNVGNPTLNDRNPTNHPTILSGDIGAPNNKTDNSYHVVTMRGFYNNLNSLDGLFIEEGNANGDTNVQWHWKRGGGIFIESLITPSSISGSNNGVVEGMTFVNCIIRNNEAEEGGGGVYVRSAFGNIANQQFSKCTFENNTCTGSWGGAVLNDAYFGTNVCIYEDCIFKNNSASYEGGAMALDGRNKGNCTPVISHSIFENNTAERGGALVLAASDTGYVAPSISDCIFSNNTGNNAGGAIYGSTHENGTVDWNICQSGFITNRADGYAGGAIASWGQGTDEGLILNSTFVENSAESQNNKNNKNGGAIFFDISDNVAHTTKIEGCHFKRNKTNWAGGAIAFSIFGNAKSNGAISNCYFYGNESLWGGAMNINGNTNTNLSISNAHFNNNKALRANNTGGDGGAMIIHSSVKIDNCHFTNNHAGYSGGALTFSLGNNISTINNSIFINNQADNSGGAIRNQSGDNQTSLPQFIQCIFQGNTANSNGGAILNGGGNNGVCTPTIKSSTFYNNSAAFGKSISSFNGHVIIDNSILWGGTGSNILLDNSSPSTVSDCIIEGGFAGGTNISNIAPIFTNSTNYDLSLQSNSFGVNEGNNNSLPIDLISDIVGNDRILETIVDMGAIERDTSTQNFNLSATVEGVTCTGNRDGSIRINWAQNNINFNGCDTVYFTITGAIQNLQPHPTQTSTKSAINTVNTYTIFNFGTFLFSPHTYYLAEGFYTITMTDCDNFTTETTVYVPVADHDEDNIADCNDLMDCGLPTTVTVTKVAPTSCNGLPTGSITFNPTDVTTGLSYSIDGSFYQSSNVFDVSTGIFNRLFVKNNTTQCVFAVDTTIIIALTNCAFEGYYNNCNDGVDNNGNGLIDCDDSGCSATISQFSNVQPPTCAIGNDGSIRFKTSSLNIKVSADGGDTYLTPEIVNNQGIFYTLTNLPAGTYTFKTYNEESGCSASENITFYCLDNPPDCSHPDFQALKDLFIATGGGNWATSNWDTSRVTCDPCAANWYGITCSDFINRVIKIDLSENNLDGTLPASLVDLTFLDTLNLSNNNLQDCIPAELDSFCVRNVVVDVSNNNLLGEQNFMAFCDNQAGSCNATGCNPCDSIIFSNTPFMGDSTFIACDSIVSGMMVQNSMGDTSEVTYVAGQQIKLMPGFHAEAGTEFLAKIVDTCSNNLLEETEAAALNRVTLSPIIIEKTSPDLAVFPNPFSDKTTIQFTLNEPSPLQLTLYNLNGQKVSTILQKNNYSTGQHQLELHADKLPVGVYFLTLQTVNERITKKLIIQQQ